MPSIREIQTQAQEVVRLSTGGLNVLNKLELDEITYNIVDKDGSIKTSFTGRNQRQAAYDDADNRNAALEEGYPFRVEAESNLAINPDTGALDFVVGSQIGILFPLDDINAAAKSIEAAVDCEVILQIIQREIQTLIDQLLSKATAVSDLVPFGQLASIPSNPLKILSWVKKFVAMYLGPQMLAIIDLAIQLAQLAAAITSITQAAIAAQNNLRLCAASAFDTAIDTLIDSSLAAVGTSEAEINKALSQISSIETQISGITGKPTKFDTTSIDALISSATAENKAALVSEVDEYVKAPFEAQSLDLELTGGVTGTATTDDDGNVTMSTSLAGAFTGDVTIPNAGSGGTGGNFEIVTNGGNSNQVRYVVSGGIITDVIVGL